MKKSVLFVNTDMCWGGIEVSLINLLWRLDTSKYDIHLALLSENLAFLDRLPSTVHVHLLNRNSEELHYSYRRLYAYIQKLASSNRNFLQKIAYRVLRVMEEKCYVSSVRKKFGKFDAAVAYRTGTAADVVSKFGGVQQGFRLYTMDI